MKKAPLEDIGSMRPAGTVLLLAGVGLFVFGLQYDATFAASQEPLYGIVPDRIFNIGRVTDKLVMLIAGSALSLLGSGILLVAGIRRDIRATTPSASAPSRPGDE